MNLSCDFLFARPSFVGGMASALDMGNTLSEYNDSATGSQADAIALGNDWQAVGRDMQRAMAQGGQRLAQRKPQRRHGRGHRR